MERSDAFDRRCYASAKRSVEWLKEEGYYAHMICNTYNSIVGFCVEVPTVSGSMDLSFMLDEKCHYERCEVRTTGNLVLPVSFSEEEYAMESINGIVDVLLAKNNTFYSIFPPRLVGFRIMFVRDTDISDREYNAMVRSGRWKMKRDETKLW